MISQLRSAPNLLTLLRLIFIPFIVIAVLERHYGWALGLFVAAGISDGLDGLLARLLKQKTVLGQYLDPIADKLLLSTMFIVLAATHRLLWRVTVLVFARDILIFDCVYAAVHDGRPEDFSSEHYRQSQYPGPDRDRPAGAALRSVEGAMDRDSQNHRRVFDHCADRDFRRALRGAGGL